MSVSWPGDDPAGSWRVDLSGEVPQWDRGAGATTVTAHGSLTDLLLLLYGRPVSDRIEVRGDARVAGVVAEADEVLAALGKRGAGLG